MLIDFSNSWACRIGFLCLSCKPTHSHEKGMKKIISLVVLFTVVCISFISNCNKSSDKKAYEEVVATMSMQKARHFFAKYPYSTYRDKLVSELIEWCKREETEECYRLMLHAIPKDHPQYKEMSSYYESRFGKNRERG